MVGQMGVEGGYLRFDPASKGTLFLVWSKKEVPEALAFFSPKKPVPGYKYSTQGGKMELIRDIQTDHKRYHSGWCSFLKTCKQYDGEVTVLSHTGPKDIMIVLNNSKNAVNPMEVNKPVTLDDIVGVACVPKDALEFNCQTMTSSLFLEKANEKGYGQMLS